LLDKLTAQQRGTLTFVIGGAYGLDQKVLTRAQQCISLSPLTFSHQVVRLVLLEQLYRAFTILEGTDYHK
jgi:23S rRNA (pseudouridine1915-N3)-methyltransferase